MKRKQMIAALFLLAALTGCANQGKSAEEEEGVNSEASAGVEAGANGGCTEAETAGTNNGAEGSMTANAATGTNAGTGADASTSTNGETEAGLDKENDMQADEEAYVGFGDVATMDFNVNGRNLPIYCVDTEEKKVALSFDAAWGNEDTAEILSILKEHDIHVTFFMTGGWVESYPDDVKAILAAGHDLGNHSENHKNMSELSEEEKTEELMAVHRKVKEITGYDMFLFRPPYGDYDNAVIDVAKDCGYYAIQWDVDSLDWKNEGLDNIIDTVTNHKNLGNGSIILCHNGAEYTAQALDTLITKLEEQGYEIVPISELIYREDFHMNYEGRQIEN